MHNLILLFISLCLLSCDPNPSLPKDAPTLGAVLIGGGIMSATVGAMLKELDPELTIEIFERLEEVALESSAAWNNAGTGHAAFAELNYTPEVKGTIDISKALRINEHFLISKQFWAYEVAKKQLIAQDFIHSVPHISFVIGETDINFLKKRVEALSKSPLFHGMEYSEDREIIQSWAPLLIEGRDLSQRVAATRMKSGTDINFGALTKGLIKSLEKKPFTTLSLRHEIIDLKRNDDKTWTVIVKNLATGHKRAVKAKFVFIGAGGGSLELLQKSKIPEARGYGGFPVGGQWLVTNNPKLIKRHHAKVYGQASLGAPPMSVPHLDTRVINGKNSLLFGPFATFSTKFLKNGSWTDMFASLSIDNIMPMLEAGWHNVDLTKYLINQLRLSLEERIQALRVYFPNAKAEDWYLANAGQRVQVIKDDPKKGGVLQFGTELVGAKDGSIIALLGASPGASSAAQIALDVLKRCFKDKFEHEWQPKLKMMIPSLGVLLNDEPELFKHLEEHTNKLLELTRF